MGAAPAAGRDALLRYHDEWTAEGPEAWEHWLPEIGRLADNLGRLIGAPAGSVSLVPNVSLALTGIASALDFSGDRNEIVVEATQFPTVTYVLAGWTRYGATYRVVESDDGRTIPTERLVAAITERTRLVVLSHAAYVSGALIDVAAVAARCRETGARFVLDIYQTAGTYPVDLATLGVDYAVGGSHKWLCGGPGCGFFYVRPDLQSEFVPAVTGWMAHADPFAFEPAPIRIGTGSERGNTGTPTIPGYLVARAGHDALLEVGIDNVRAHNVRLTTRLAEGALARGFTVPTPLQPEQRTGWIGMDFERSKEVSRRLIAERVYHDYRPGCGLRVSPHFYTSDVEIETFFERLDTIRRAL